MELKDKYESLKKADGLKNRVELLDHAINNNIKAIKGKVFEFYGVVDGETSFYGVTDPFGMLVDEGLTKDNDETSLSLSYNDDHNSKVMYLHATDENDDCTYGLIHNANGVIEFDTDSFISFVYYHNKFAESFLKQLFSNVLIDKFYKQLDLHLIGDGILAKLDREVKEKTEGIQVLKEFIQRLNL